MAENGSDSPARRIVIELTPSGLQMKLEGMSPDDAEMYLAKTLAAVQRGLIVGQVNALLDQRRVNDKLRGQRLG